MPIKYMGALNTEITGNSDRLFQPTKSNLPVPVIQDRFIIRGQTILEPDQVKQVRGTGLSRNRPLHTIKRIKSNVLAYKQHHTRDTFQQVEYDLSEVGRIEDSVSGNRCTVIQNKNGSIEVLSFLELFNRYNHLVQERDKDRINLPGIKALTWVDGAASWENIRQIIRHKISKKGVHVYQKHGFTSVTCDHSLIERNTLQEIKAEDLGTKHHIAKITGDISRFVDESEIIDLSQYVINLSLVSISDNDIKYYYCGIGKQKNIVRELTINRFVSKKDLLVVLGAYVSEGSVCYKKDGRFRGFCISNKDSIWLNKVQKCFNRLFGNISTLNTFNDGMSKLVCDRELISGLFASLAGYKSADKFLPSFVYHLDKEHAQILLNYMIDGDGHRERYGWSYTSKSIKLISGYSTLLRLLGINHTFNYRHNHGRVYYSVRTNLYFEKDTVHTNYDYFDYNDEYVFDLEVDNSHMFVDAAGQILLHNTDSYVRRAFTMKTALMFKEGWELFGKNPNTVKYIKRRFKQIETATSQSFAQLLRQTGSDLIKTSNCYWIKVRNAQASGGQERRNASGKSLQPIAGYFIAPPESIEIKTDDFGNVKRYRQKLPQHQFFKEYRPEDVIHFFYDKKDGFLAGTPTIVPVADDIRALRRIEENIEMLIYQHLFPLFHYQVGTEDAPALMFPDGRSEIDIARSQIANMPSEGGIVTPERHEIKMIGSEGRALRAESYLKHFKQRVFAGLGVGSVDFGEGETANRATADNMSRTMVDSVKDFQRIMEYFLECLVIRELMLESTFDLSNIGDEDNEVEFRFREIDIESQIKIETNAADLFAKNFITRGEGRRRIGKEPFTEEEKLDTFWELIEKPKALIVASGDPSSLTSMEMAGSEAFQINEPERNKAAGELEKRQISVKKAASTGKIPQSSKAVASRNRPQNQFGQKSSPRKFPSRNKVEINTEIKDHILGNAIFLLDNHIKVEYNDIRTHLVSRISAEQKFDFDITNGLIQTAKERMIFILQSYTKSQFLNGFNVTGGNPAAVQISLAIRNLEGRVEKFVGTLMKELLRQIKKDISPSNDSLSDIPSKLAGIFDALEFRTDFINRSELTKAKNFGLALAFKSLGNTEAFIISSGGCDKCHSRHNDKIDLSHVTLDDVPALHPNCECTIALEPVVIQQTKSEV